MSTTSFGRPHLADVYSYQEEGERAEYDEDIGVVDDPHAPAHIYFFDRIPTTDGRFQSNERQQEAERDLPHQEDGTNREFHDKYFAMASDKRRSVDRKEEYRAEVDREPSQRVLNRKTGCITCLGESRSRDESDGGSLEVRERLPEEVFDWGTAQNSRMNQDKFRHASRRSRSVHEDEEAREVDDDQGESAEREDEASVYANTREEAENENETIEEDEEPNEIEVDEERESARYKKGAKKRAKFPGLRNVVMCNHEPGVNHPECDAPATTSCKPTCCDVKPHHREGAYNRCRTKYPTSCVTEGHYALSSTSRAKFTTTRAPQLDETW